MTYQEFGGCEEDTSLEPWEIGIRNETPKKWKKKCSAHEVGESGGWLCQAQVHVPNEVRHKAHCIRYERQVL